MTDWLLWLLGAVPFVAFAFAGSDPPPIQPAPATPTEDDPETKRRADTVTALARQRLAQQGRLSTIFTPPQVGRKRSLVGGGTAPY